MAKRKRVVIPDYLGGVAAVCRAAELDTLDEARSGNALSVEISLWKFVADVENGRSISREMLEFIAQGIMRHLDGKTPWPKKRGNKQSSTQKWPFVVAAAVDELREQGMSIEKACGHLANTGRFGIGDDALRKIYDRARKADPFTYNLMTEMARRLSL